MPETMNQPQQDNPLGHLYDTLNQTYAGGAYPSSQQLQQQGDEARGAASYLANDITFAGDNARRMGRGANATLSDPNNPESPRTFSPMTDEQWSQVAGRVRQQFPNTDPEVFRQEYQTNRRQAEEAGIVDFYRRSFTSGGAQDPTRQGVGYVLERLPFTSAPLVNANRVRESANALRDGKATDNDYANIGAFMAARDRGEQMNWGEQVVDSLSQLPGFAIEFAVTGGAFRAAASGVTNRIAARMGEGAARTMVARSVAGAVGVAAQTAFQPARVGASIAEQATPSIQADPRQVQIGAEPGLAGAIARGVGDQYIENLTERASNLLPGGGRVARAVGYGGIAPEIGEEFLGDILRGATGVRPDYGTVGNLAAGVTGDRSRLGQGLRETSVMAASFAVFGLGIHGLDRVGQRNMPTSQGPQLTALPEHPEFGTTAQMQEFDQAIEQNRSAVVQWGMTAPVAEVRDWARIYPELQPVVRARQDGGKNAARQAAQTAAETVIQPPPAAPVGAEQRPTSAETPQTATQAPETPPQQATQAAPGGVPAANAPTSAPIAPEATANAPAPSTEATATPTPAATAPNGASAGVVPMSPGATQVSSAVPQAPIQAGPQQERRGPVRNLRLGSITSLDKVGRIDDPTEKAAAAKFGAENTYRLDLHNAAGQSVGNGLIAQEGGTLHVEWIGATGLAGGEGRGVSHRFGSTQMMRLIPEVVAQFPTAHVATYIRSVDRLRQGEKTWVELDKYRTQQKVVNETVKQLHADAAREGIPAEQVQRDIAEAQRATAETAQNSARNEDAAKEVGTVAQQFHSPTPTGPATTREGTPEREQAIADVAKAAAPQVAKNGPGPLPAWYVDQVRSVAESKRKPMRFYVSEFLKYLGRTQHGTTAFDRQEGRLMAELRPEARALTQEAVAEGWQGEMEAAEEMYMAGLPYTKKEAERWRRHHAAMLRLPSVNRRNYTPKGMMQFTPFGPMFPKSMESQVRPKEIKLTKAEQERIGKSVDPTFMQREIEMKKLGGKTFYAAASAAGLNEQSLRDNGYDVPSLKEIYPKQLFRKKGGLKFDTMLTEAEFMTERFGPTPDNYDDLWAQDRAEKFWKQVAQHLLLDPGKWYEHEQFNAEREQLRAIAHQRLIRKDPGIEQLSQDEVESRVDEAVARDIVDADRQADQAASGAGATGAGQATQDEVGDFNPAELEKINDRIRQKPQTLFPTSDDALVRRLTDISKYEKTRGRTWIRVFINALMTELGSTSLNQVDKEALGFDNPEQDLDAPTKPEANIVVHRSHNQGAVVVDRASQLFEDLKAKAKYAKEAESPQFAFKAGWDVVRKVLTRMEGVHDQLGMSLEQFKALLPHLASIESKVSPEVAKKTMRSLRVEELGHPERQYGLKDISGIRPLAEQITRNSKGIEDVTELMGNLKKIGPALIGRFGEKDGKRLGTFLREHAWSVRAAENATDKVESLMLQYLRSKQLSAEELGHPERRAETTSGEIPQTADLVIATKIAFRKMSNRAILRVREMAERMFPANFRQIEEMIDRGLEEGLRTEEIADQIERLATGELGMPTGATAPAPSVQSRPKELMLKVHGVVNAMYELLGVQRHVGHLEGRNFRAMMQMKPITLFIKGMWLGDVATNLHEVVHGIDAKENLLPSLDNLPPGVRTGLINAGQTLYPDEQVFIRAAKEGLSELIRMDVMSLTLPGDPNTQAALNWAWAKMKPETAAKLNRTRDMVAKLAQMNGIERTGSRISTSNTPAEPEGLTAKERWSDWTSNLVPRFLDNWVTRAQVLTEVDRDVEAVRGPQKLGKLSTLYAALRKQTGRWVSQFIDEGLSVTDVNGVRTKIGRSWDEIIGPLAKFPELLTSLQKGWATPFEVFVVARRVVFLADQVNADGKAKEPVDPEFLKDAKQALHEFTSDTNAERVAALMQTADNLTGSYNDSLRAFARMGLMNMADAERLIANDPFYTQLRRVMEKGSKRKGIGGGKGERVATGIYAMVGSGREILSPIQQWIGRMATVAMLQGEQAMRINLDNVFNTGLPGEEGVGIPGLGKWMTRIPAPKKTQQVKIPLEELSRRLNQLAGEPGIFDDILDESVMGSTLAYYFSQYTTDAGEPAYVVRRPGADGNVEDHWYVVGNQRLHRLITNEDSNWQLPPWLSATLAPMRAMRKVVQFVGTTTLPFIGQNAFLDTQTFLTNSINPASAKDLPTFFARSAWFQMQMLSGKRASDIKDQVFQLQHYSSGDFATIASFASQGAQDIYRHLTDQKNWKDMVGLVKDKGEMVVRVIQSGELAPRALEMQNALEELGWPIEKLEQARKDHPDRDPLNMHEWAYVVNRGQEVTTDWGRQGYISEQVNQYIPFFSASIAGLDRQVRQWRDYPGRMLLALAVYGAMEALHAALMKDEDWYNEQEPYLRYRYWAFPMAGKLYRLKKPQGLMNVGNVVFQETLRTLMQKDPQFLAGVRQMVGETTPPYMPAILQIPSELIGNQTWTGRPIVPHGEEANPNRMLNYQAPYVANQLTGNVASGQPFRNPFAVQGVPNVSVDRFYDRLNSLEGLRAEAGRAGHQFRQEQEYQRLHQAAQRMQDLSRSTRGQTRIGHQTLQGPTPSQERVDDLRRQQTRIAALALR